MPASLRGRRLLQQANADESAGYLPSASKPLARQPLLNTYTLALSSAAWLTRTLFLTLTLTLTPTLTLTLTPTPQP